MMLRVSGKGTAGVINPVPTKIALTISQPLLAMLIQEVLSRCPEVDVCLTAHRVSDLATFAGRDRVQVIICEPAFAEEIHRLLHEGQLLVLLGNESTLESPYGDLVVNLEAPNWSSALVAFLNAPPAHEEPPPDRRRAEGVISHRRLMAELLGQRTMAASPANGAITPASAGERLVSLLPRLGCPTTLIFLHIGGIPRPEAGATPWLDLLHTILRREDAILRIDELTFVVLSSIMDPLAIPSLLTRLSWRLWPADPAALGTSFTVWRPGQVLDSLNAPGQDSGYAEFSAPHPSDTLNRDIQVQRTVPAFDAVPDASSLLWQPGQESLKARALVVEPWCDRLPGFGSEQSLRQAVEAQEEEEFGHAGHAAGVARVAAGLAGAIGLSTADIEHLRQAALLHDGGKIALDRVLWAGRGRVSPWQRRLMEAHAGLGSELADQVGVPDTVMMAILHHHERWDGRGYPARLAGEAIPLMARVLFVAEVVDSMLRASYRREPMVPGQVARVLETGAGQLWDPELVHHAIRMIAGTARGRRGVALSR
ncbi:MAG: HD-GYP domain-containing protein [Chloroflexota bacterium]